MSGFKRFWEMTEGGPYDAPEEKNDIFKCTDCGAETHHVDGFGGEPVPQLCHPGCPSRDSNWKPGNNSDAYKKNLDQIFPNSPGAGV